MSHTAHRFTILTVTILLVAAVGVVLIVQRASAASSTPVVYVATGENFPDALGAASAAAVRGGPVLLVQKNAIPAETAAELTRLHPDVIVVAGGTAVVSDAVVTQLQAYAPSVVRAAGANRYATAVEVSKSAFPATGGGSVVLEARVAALEAQVAELEALLDGVVRDGDTLRFEAMNLQVVNGEGQTNSSNALGNVIIGYNEDNPYVRDTAERTGSHYLVVGDEHSWTAWGGVISGLANRASGSFASVTGGVGNTASGWVASVTGGSVNEASSDYSSVCGGETNSASEEGATVSGGRGNTAVRPYSSVSGGRDNNAGESYASVAGGWYNDATGYYSSVSGGYDNTASGYYSSVSGGASNIASFTNTSVSGGQSNLASNTSSSVSGGSDNTASGGASSVCGGFSNTAGGGNAAVLGGNGETWNGSFQIYPYCGCTP
jgi:hypothetical protein